MATFIKKDCACCPPSVCEGCATTECTLYALFGNVTSVAYSYILPDLGSGSGTLSFSTSDFVAWDGNVSIGIAGPDDSGICYTDVEIYGPFSDPCWMSARASLPNWVLGSSPPGGIGTFPPVGWWLDGPYNPDCPPSPGSNSGTITFS